MFPTADQVAHAVVAASRHFEVDPIEVFSRIDGDRGYIVRSRALMYAMIAIADLWGNDSMASRVCGGFSAGRASVFRNDIAAKRLKWWNPDVLAKVKAAIPDAPASPPVRPERARATTPAPARENASLPAARPPIPVPAKRMAPNFGSPPRYASRDTFAEKRALRDMLAEAVANTAKLPSQN